MIKIGVVNIDVSHPLAFSEVLLQENRARYTAVYNDGFRGDDEVEAFMKKRGLVRYASIDELAGQTDIGFIQGCNWDLHLEHAMPFIRQGKPVFIDKPIVGSIKDCGRLKTLVADGAVVLGSSSLRYASEIVDFLAIPESERGEIINVFGTCGVDEFNYGIHVVESICGLIDSDAEDVRFSSRATVGGNICDTYTISFSSGATATYHAMKGAWLPCYFLVTTTTGVYNINVDVANVYKALLDRICDYMETGKSILADVPDLCHSIEIMLAGRISRQAGGIAVKLSDIPSNDPGFNGLAFFKEYADNAKKIYLA